MMIPPASSIYWRFPHAHRTIPAESVKSFMTQAAFALRVELAGTLTQQKRKTGAERRPFSFLAMLKRWPCFRSIG